MIGKTLAHYEIIGELGRGGMGEVYRATDTKLKREVAIKVLPEELAQDKDLLARFEREAQILASLNHPNIATIHGLEDTGEIKALVLELVEGPTLADRIAEGPIALEEALAIAKQIADALEAAHDAGVIHRDLKPANVKVRDDGTVKVLDFGLAKALVRETAGGSSSESPTLTAAATSAGVILGTPAYMSPEQARGKPLDKRTDIWSYGCVLYEALTSRPAFLGETLSDTLASILDRDPDWSALPRATPKHLETLLRRCLQKQTSQRLRDIGDARLELEGTFADAAETQGRHDSSRGAMLPWTLAALLVVAMAALWVRIPEDSPRRVVRTVIPLPPDQQVTGQIGLPLAMSPDGRRLAFTAYEAGTTRLYVRELAEPEVRAVPETDGARYPFFSPDGEWVGYWAAGTLYRVLASGGPPLGIGEAPELEYGVAWGPDGTIVFADDSELFRISAAGGVAEPLGADSETAGARWPQFLADGGVLAVRDGSIVRLNLMTLEIQTLLEPALGTIKQARYLPSGHVVYGSAGDIIMVPFDLDAPDARATPVPVAQDLYEGKRSSGAVYFASSEEGTMVFVNGSVQHNLVLVDRNGRSQPLARERAAFRHPTFSPDGQRVSVAIDDDPRPTDIWLYDLRGSRERLTFEAHNITSAWTPDGTAIAFSSAERRVPSGSVYLKRLRGDDEVEKLLTDELETPYNQFPGSWSPDANLLVFTEIHPVTGFDLWLLDLSGEEVTATELLATPFEEFDPRVSPDGRWLAYTSNRSGPEQVFVRPFLDDGGEIAVSVDGGTGPRWCAATGELFFRNGPLMMVADVRTDGDFVASEPRVLFEKSFDTSDVVNYDVSPDGQRFVMIETDPRGDGRQLELVLNWFEALNRLVPSP